MFNNFICHCALCDQFLSPFRGSCCVKNGPNLLKINIYCMFWPNNVWKPVYIKLFYEIFLVYQIFNIFNCHCALFDLVMSPFRGSCGVKNGQKLPKINISCMFWPNNVWNFFLIILFYEICLVGPFSTIHCHCALYFTTFWPLSGGHVV